MGWWIPVAAAAAGYLIDRKMGGNGLQGAMMGGSLGYGSMGSGGTAAADAGGKGVTAMESASSANSLGGGANLLGGTSTAVGTGATTGATTGLVGSGIPTDGREIGGAGIDLLSNHDAGLELGTGMESGLTEVGSNAGYQFGDPFYNTSESVMQNKNFITEDMFKPTDIMNDYDTMGFDIDDMGNVVDFNATDMELFQPKGTERQLTMQDYAERGVDKFGKMMGKAGDYAYENPDKLILGGLSAASLLEGSNKNNTQTQTMPAGFKQANVSGLNVPNKNQQYIYRPRNRRNFRIG
jgi:hypothetical protein